MQVPSLRTSQGEDAVVDYVRGFNVALHTQLDLMRRFLTLHPKPPPDLDVWESRGVPEFADQIDDFALSICDALGIYDVNMFDSVGESMMSEDFLDIIPSTSNHTRASERFEVEESASLAHFAKSISPESAAGPREAATLREPTSKDVAFKETKDLCLLTVPPHRFETKASPAEKDMVRKFVNNDSNGETACLDFGETASLGITEYSISPPTSPKKVVRTPWGDSSETPSCSDPHISVENEPAAAELPASGVVHGRPGRMSVTSMTSMPSCPNSRNSFGLNSVTASASMAARQRFIKSPGDEEVPTNDSVDHARSSISQYRPRFRSLDSGRSIRLSNEDPHMKIHSEEFGARTSNVSTTSRGSELAHQNRPSRNSRRSRASGYWKEHGVAETLEELRNLWDSEGESPSKRRKCPSGVLNPQWIGRLGWDIAVILLVLIDAMVLPFQMAYKDSENPDNFDTFWLWLTTSFFACDMVVNFFTAYEAGLRDKDMELGALVTRKSRIACHYIRSWFPIDFVSTIPWSQVTKLLTGGGESSSAAQTMKLTKALKFIRFLRLMRMLRLAKLAQIWERVEQKMGSLVLTQTVALLRVMFMLVSICHWNACLWWIIGKPQNLFTDLMSNEARESFEKIPHWTTLPRKFTPYDPVTWTWLEVPVLDAYIFCFYWTLGVMRTMPAEVTPVNKPERVYLMIFMFFAFSAFAISISQITQAFFKFSERKRVFNEDMSALRMHLRNFKVPDGVQAKIKAYSQFLFERRRLLAKENNLLQNLPIHLHERLKAARLTQHLQKLEVFRPLRGEALLLVSEVLADIRDMLPGDLICVRGRTADAAWVKMNGRLSQVSVDPNNVMTQQPMMNEIDSDVVDEDCLMLSTHSYSSPDTVMVTLCAEVMRIDKKKFFAVRKKHPNFERLLRNATSGYDPMAMNHTQSQKPNQVPQRVDQREENGIADIGAIVST